MAADMSPDRSSIHNGRNFRARILGTGAADPTLEVGQGFTVKWISTGLYRFTWPEAPGTFVGWQHSLAADTTSDLKGYTVVRDVYDTTNHQMDVAVYNASNNLADLAAAQYLDIVVTFAEGTP